MNSFNRKTSRIQVLFIYMILMLFFTSSNLFSAVNSVDKKGITKKNNSTTKKFEGKINDKYNIILNLEFIEGNIKGNYRYRKGSDNIILNGSIDYNGFIVLNEYDKKGNINAVFTGKFTDENTVEGLWSTKNRCYKFYFVEVQDLSLDIEFIPSANYYFYSNKVNGFILKFIEYKEGNYQENNSIILLKKEKQTIPFHYISNSGNYSIKNISSDIKHIELDVKSVNPIKIENHTEQFFFYDMNFDGVKELFVSDETDYSVYNLKTGNSFDIIIKDENGKINNLGNSIYSYKGGFKLNSTEREFETYESNSVTTGSYEKYKFIDGSYYLKESKITEYHELGGVITKTVKVDF